MRWRRSLTRWHVWLGWLIALPLILWCATGLFMAARPIEEVRGEHLKRPRPPLRVPDMLRSPAAPPEWDEFPGGEPLQMQSLSLEMQPRGPVWIVGMPDGLVLRADPSTGALLRPVEADEAAAIARAAFAGTARLVELRRTRADAPPLELRKPTSTWRARFADGTHLFIEANSGQVLATRTRLWRAYDFMWGLHIMAPRRREDTHHPVLIAFASVSLLGTAIGTVLLFLRRRRR